MANPAKYDRQIAVAEATRLFWQKGFYATSTRDLQQALNMRPGSIYAAFGSKEGLYRESLLAYRERIESKFAQHLQQHSSLLRALKHFLLDILVTNRSELSHDICLFTRTQTEINDDAIALQQLCTQMAQSFEDNLTALCAGAQKTGELNPNYDPRDFARLVLIQLAGLRSYMLRDKEGATIRHLIEQAFDLLALLAKDNNAVSLS